MSEVREFLAEVPLFVGTDERTRELAAESLQHRRYAPSSLIFQEGDQGEALYIIRSGQIKLSKIDLGGHEKTLAILPSPEFFGEMALLNEEPRNASATSLDDSEVLLLYKDDFSKLLAHYPKVSLNLTSTLASRLRGMDDEAQVLSYKDAQGRVAYVLLRLYRNGLIEFAPSGQAFVKLTHQELASLAGTSRETVTRALRSLEAEKVIETKPKEILLTDPSGLEEIFHGIR